MKITKVENPDNCPFINELKDGDYFIGLGQPHDGNLYVKRHGDDFNCIEIPYGTEILYPHHKSVKLVDIQEITYWIK